MIHPRPRWAAFCVSLLIITGGASRLSAGEPFSPVGWLSINVFTGSSETICDKCGAAHSAAEQCVLVVRVKERVVGKKKVYDCKVRYEWVTIPETRYRIHYRWVTKTVPCAYCQPVCEAKDTSHVKVRVRQCVKEPYTVYRQVKRPVCVKQPRYERTEVTITKNVCSRCGGQGCTSCK